MGGNGNDITKKKKNFPTQKHFTLILKQKKKYINAICTAMKMENEQLKVFFPKYFPQEKSFILF